jgi:hypothetical protein
MVEGERATVKESYHVHGGEGEREEINWPFLGPPVGHWDDAGSYQWVGKDIRN